MTNDRCRMASPGGARLKSRFCGSSTRGPFSPDSGRRISSNPTGAFTLVEMVISAAVMSLILGAAYVCLNSGLVGQKLIESRGQTVQQARVALTMMSADLRSACPPFKGAAFLGMDRLIEEVEADNLDLATHNFTPRKSGQGDYCEISYFLSKEPQSGEWSLWRRRDPTPDDEPLAGGSREEIVRGLSGLRFEYYDGFDWYDEWGDVEGKGKAENSLRYQPNLEGMPEAVRITLWIEPAARTMRRPTERRSDPVEPPLVFQTVARLNLAPMNRSSTNGGGGQEPDEAGRSNTAEQ